MESAGSGVARGMVCALAGGALWGFSGSCAQLLFRDYGLSSLWLTSVRMAVAGALMLAFAAVTQRSRLLAPLRSWRAIVRLACFAIFGIAFTQLAYLTTIEHSNASTATVLEYIGPVLVMLVECVRQRRRPVPREAAALAMVVAGTFFLATHGDPTQLVLTPAVLGWGLLSAVSMVFYTLIPVPLMDRYGPVTTLAWSLVMGAVALCAVARPWGAGYALDVRGWLALVGGLSVLGTAVAFLLYFRGIHDAGPTRASMLASDEVVSATLLAVLWLGTPFAPMDALGLVLIVGATLLLAEPKGRAVASDPAPSDPAR